MIENGRLKKLLSMSQQIQKIAPTWSTRQQVSFDAIAVNTCSRCLRNPVEVCEPVEVCQQVEMFQPAEVCQTVAVRQHATAMWDQMNIPHSVNSTVY
ncbi:hypothetical protein PoB_000057300 [Plakobranchus ocellatus]|uniref:Uncharacterized protein n=1 Tax=Plakobranchus ocellatus TaxID=259542 RepID=A0AAV3XUX2_9GAST|nr:hypothetical protein PoB_000057300 [Plakobranchus ocellatus]